MTVIEVGIIKSGIPIYIKNFQDTKQAKDDTHILKSAFLSAIQTTVAISFTAGRNESFEIKLKKHIILINEIENYMFYAVTNKNSKFLFPIKESVAKLSKEIDLQSLDDLNVTTNKDLVEPKLLEIFKDLSLSPSERAKNAF